MRLKTALIASASLLISQQAWAQVPISGLPAATTPLVGTEIIPLVQSGVTKQTAVSNLPTGGGGLTNVYDASSCTVASGTGSADAAPCIQGFINTASTAGGGLVWIGAGFRNLKSQLVLKRHVTVECVSNGYTFDSNTLSYGTTSGSIFAVNWGSGSGAGNDPTKAAMKIQYDTGVINCGWWYPSQSASASTPTEYGSTILVADALANSEQHIIGNWGANPYNFIDIRAGLAVGGGCCGFANATVENNVGSPIHYAVAMNFQVDWSNFSGNKWNSGAIWEADPTPASHLRGWIAANGIAYYIGFGDWYKLTNEQAWGYNNFILWDGVTACCGGFVDTGGITLDGVQADANFVTVEQVSGSTLHDLSFNGGKFTAFNPVTNAAGAVIADTNNVTIPNINMSNVTVNGPTQNIIYLHGSGQSIGNITLSGVQGNASSTGYAYDISSANSMTILGGTYTGYNSTPYNPAGTFANQPIIVGDFQ